MRVFWERYGDGDRDDPAHADVVDRPLAPLEGADPLPRPALAGRDVRRPRQRPIRPPGRRRRVRRHGVRRRRRRGPGRDRRRSGRSSSGCRWARAGRSGSPPSIRSASQGVVFDRASPVPIAGSRCAGDAATSSGPHQRRGLGEVQHPLLASRLARLRRVLLRRALHRAALDQADRGRASAGRSRPTPRR